MLFLSQTLLDSNRDAELEVLRRELEVTKRKVKAYGVAEKDWGRDRERLTLRLTEQEARAAALSEKVKTMGEQLKGLSLEREAELQEALRRERDLWVYAFPASAEGIAFREACVANYLLSEDFSEKVEDKTLQYFEKGFEGCRLQFAAAGYPPPDADASFLDLDAAMDSMLAAASPAVPPLSPQAPPTAGADPGGSSEMADDSPSGAA